MTRFAFTYHVASSVVLRAHFLPLPQIILQQVSDLRVGVAVATLMTRRVAVPAGAIVTAVTMVVWHGCSSRVILAVAMAPEAALQLAAICLVVSSDIVCPSAGLNAVVQLENGDGRKHEQPSGTAMTQQTGLIIIAKSLRSATYIYDQHMFFHFAQPSVATFHTPSAATLSLCVFSARLSARHSLIMLLTFVCIIAMKLSQSVGCQHFIMVRTHTHSHGTTGAPLAFSNTENGVIF